MYLSITLASILTVSALATPASSRQSTNGANRVVVQLLNNGIELGTTVQFDDVDGPEVQRPVISGPFTTVNILIDEGAELQTLRCQVLDQHGNALIANRGENTDITFADGGNGPWTFQEEEVRVSEVICDPDFVAVDAGAFDVRVVLQNQGIELGSQTVFEDFSERARSGPVGLSGPFNTVEIVVGELVDPQDLRCKLIDQHGQAIVAIRGGNKDITFADGDGGLWNFVEEARVRRIICDDKFEADPVPVEE